ncbi:DUF2238 domain-containing protein [Geotalea uraniireducens]|nr:DUF2238 domain-containing protein [Geotalea uraniireducens]
MISATLEYLRPQAGRETLTFTMPYRRFLEMEATVAGSFLEEEPWLAAGRLTVRHRRSETMSQPRNRREPRFLVLATVTCLAVSAIRPHDYPTWLMEIAPILIIAPLLVASYRRLPLTTLLYRLLFVHALILMVGGHYTYAEVPLGNWLKELFGFARNHYDRIGHFAQGFVPAILTREILLRRSPLLPGKWLFLLTTSVCLAFSACYEFIEWWSALLGGSAADAFLGTQGDVWDTQWDMFFCLIGALTAQLLLARIHDRALRETDAAVAGKWPVAPEG